MFPGCPSVRPDVRPDFFVYAITQVLFDGISSNLVRRVKLDVKIN